MVSVKWYGINALEFQYSGGSFMIDPYVSRSRTKIVVPEEQEKYLRECKPDFVLMTHSHWDHLPDMPYLIAKTGTVLYASKTACNIMRALGVEEKNLHELSYGEVLRFPGLTVTCLESRHMGVMPEDRFYDTVPKNTDFSIAESWKCGEVFAFKLEMDGLTVLNGGSANLYLPSMKGLSCDWLLYGISRWKEGFPQLLTENLSFKHMIGVHHDEFTRPLSEFSLRDDLKRLKNVLPDLPAEELPVLHWTELK
ncbi:MAG: MBL fold metallo-hydrolase [Lentisphaeria bacterium]|nr:MBL fold metallo-hydrolase [Lentisphaeria bacterium]